MKHLSFAPGREQAHGPTGRILVISPHPDDESVGCGGTLRRHVLQNDDVHVVFLTSGEKGGHGLAPEEAGRVREQEARAAAEILGISHIEFWRQRDGALRANSYLLKQLREKIVGWKPGLLYVPHSGEMHPDHRASARLVRRTLSDLPRESRPVVRMYEVWTPMQRMDHVIDISPYMDAKIAAIRAHQSQCRVMRFDEAAPALNRYRGEMHSGWPAAQYAEIFAEMREPRLTLKRVDSPDEDAADARTVDSRTIFKALPVGELHSERAEGI